MKKTLIVAAVAALTGTAAFAQSSVTIYGRFNTTIERMDNNGSKSTAENNNASRLGFKGVEDMGGGLKAGFQLEHGFDSSNGIPAAAFWGRQSEVNLSGGFGMIRVGRFTSEAYFATADYVSMHNHDTGLSEDALYAYIGRNTNKVAYRLPTLVPGLSVEGGYSLSEAVPGAAPGYKNTFDGAINYQTGPVALGLGYEGNGAANQVAVRALVDLGSFVVGGYVQRDKSGWAAPNGNLGTRTNVRVSAAYILGGSEFHVNFGNAGKYSNVANSAAKQLTLAYNYNLSKRTKVYAYYTEVKDGAANIYNNANFGVARTGRDTKFDSFAIGVRHNF